MVKVKAVSINGKRKARRGRKRDDHLNKKRWLSPEIGLHLPLEQVWKFQNTQQSLKFQWSSCHLSYDRRCLNLEAFTRLEWEECLIELLFSCCLFLLPGLLWIDWVTLSLVQRQTRRGLWRWWIHYLIMCVRRSWTRQLGPSRTTLLAKQAFGSTGKHRRRLFIMAMGFQNSQKVNVENTPSASHRAGT